MIEYGSRIDELCNEYKRSQQLENELQRDLGGLQTSLNTVIQAQQLIQHVAKDVQDRVHIQIATVVTQAIKTVFGDDGYEFKINFNKKRGKTDAEMVFIRNGVEFDPTTASGGGIVDVAAFALRLVCLVLHTPTLHRVLILDEPFKFVSQEYRENVREVLLTLSKELNVQIIQITHSPELECGTVIKVS